MKCPTRRRERNPELIKSLKKRFLNVIDLTYFEKEGKALEGKGSLVFDHRNRRVFCALSQRSHLEVINELLNQWNQIAKEPYHAVTFNASDKDGTPIYHTDCMLSLNHDYAVVCIQAVRKPKQRHLLVESLRNGRHPYQLIEISHKEVENMAANMQALYDAEGIPSIVMSKRAYQGLDPFNRAQLENSYKLVVCDIEIIEQIGGGSARCMLAEDFSDSSTQEV